MKRLHHWLIILLASASCSTPQMNSKQTLVTLDPGHFHAALIQKTMYPGIDSTVYVFAPDGGDLDLHLERIKGYNQASNQPTHWNEVVYRGPDFLQRFSQESKGQIVVLAGDNKLKTSYITTALQAGYHVLSDKPMVIQGEAYPELLKAFDLARQKNLILYDIMTERFEVTEALQREIMMNKEVFGTLTNGSPDDPAIYQESIHHFFKEVSGKPLIRPTWFFDPSHQGEGIVDVTTHLIDLAHWKGFPNTVLDTSEVRMTRARKWQTRLSHDQFTKITNQPIPNEMSSMILNDSLSVPSNGEIDYSLKGVHIRVHVEWRYQSAPGTGDTHQAIVMGSRARLRLVHTIGQPELLIEPTSQDSDWQKSLESCVQTLAQKYPGLKIIQEGNRWRLDIPAALREGHEAHFARVASNFFDYTRGIQPLPEWEVAGMKVKYYITTQAQAMPKGEK